MKTPKTLQEAIKFFADSDNCTQVMIEMRWSNGVVCPRCGSTENNFISTRRIWQCKGCNRQFSAKVGTLMEDSPIGLDKWLTAIWMISNAKNGISSYEIHRAIGITQKSAWFLLHRIRLAFQSGSFDKLSGQVEVDETYIGGKARFMHKGKRIAKGRGMVGKSIVVGLLERGGNVRTKVIPNTRTRTLQTEVRENVKPGSHIFTDTLASYDSLNPEYVHQAVDHAKEYVRGNVHTNGMENFWSLFKRCVKGTYVSVEPFHLFRYLDEESFRFNNRLDNDQGRFISAVKSIGGKRLTYKQLTGNMNNA